MVKKTRGQEAGGAIRVEVIAGCMWAGKTEELARRLKRLILGSKSVYLFKPKRDTRPEREPERFACLKNPIIFVKTPAEIMSYFTERQIDLDTVDVVAIDELQFFSKSHLDVMLSMIDWLAGEGIRVIIAGLDNNFWHKPFNLMPYVLAVADDVTKLKAVCNKCKDQDARFTQKLVDGKPASATSPMIEVGDEVQKGGHTIVYEARCRNCYEPPK